MCRRGDWGIDRAFSSSACCAFQSSGGKPRMGSWENTGTARASRSQAVRIGWLRTRASLKEIQELAGIAGGATESSDDLFIAIDQRIVGHGRGLVFVVF